MNLQPLGRPYYPALDGLRGLAILLVLLYHNFGFVSFFEIGWLGVDLFFVLSGFLITDILLQTKGSRHFLRNFYLRRFLRIFPLYYLCLFIFIVFVPKAMHPFYDASYYNGYQLWFWTYLQNWLYIIKHPEQSTLLNHFWSLAVEEQFYMIWPLIILWVSSIKRQLAIILSLLAFVIFLRIFLWIYQPYDISYINLYTFSRIDGLCIGCALSLIRRIDSGFIVSYSWKILAAVAGLNCLLLALKYALNINFPYIELAGYTSIAIVFGVLVTKAIAPEPNLVNRYLNNQTFRFLGKISYSLYVFHWPIYLILFPMLTHMFGDFLFLSNSSNEMLSAIVSTISALIVSIASYYLIEKYFLSFKKVVA